MTTPTRDTVQDHCTEAVFERGETYHTEGRVYDRARIDQHVTATIHGSRQYEVTVDIAAPDFAPSCTCPYDGPGICKHVVAVLLSLANGVPPDESPRIDRVLSTTDDAALRTFLRHELAQDGALRDRFLARFDENPDVTVDEYRERVEQLFTEHTTDYPVVTHAIDFSTILDVADEYRDRGRYLQAATVYRGFLDGLDAHMDLVDAAYDHYTRTFQTALDAYIACLTNTDAPPESRSPHVRFLIQQAASGTDYLQEQYADALAELDAAGVIRVVIHAGYDDVLLLDRETASAVLTGDRRELLDHIHDGDVESVQHLAKEVDRDKAVVSRDLESLFTHDLIEYREAGSQKIPELKHETVIVEPV
ncbi:SWIM zinc finger family protein [Halarchaeum salinum]|uniref:SWIM-type domain-containing protein n=1 Tax=Halarchaeum salinum TaxID=489912 RepID=A0AAV3S684_9EURY